MSTVNSPAKGRKFRGLDAVQRREERRARLVEAGLEAFGRRGFQASTVKDVCTEARLTERYFYESFVNREELFSAVYHHCIQHLRQLLMNSLSSLPPDPRAMTQTALRTLFAALRDDPRMARVLFIDVLAAHGDMDKHSLNAMQGFADLLQGYIQLLFPQLKRAQLNPSLISTGLVGACVLLIMRWTVTGFQEPLEEMVRNCAVLFEALATQVGTTPAPTAA
jgi:AcrR family transcriptional regulator